MSSKFKMGKMNLTGWKANIAGWLAIYVLALLLMIPVFIVIWLLAG
jgi:hypothetical protein